MGETMPLLFGCILGFFVFTHIWVFIGPIVALLNFLIGRFFIASVIMTISLWCGTFVWDDLIVGREEYEVLLVFGLLLEGIKWAIKLWWSNRNSEPEPELEALPFDVTFNIVDDKPKKKQRRKTVVLHKNAKGVYVPDGS